MLNITMRLVLACIFFLLTAPALAAMYRYIDVQDTLSLHVHPAVKSRVFQRARPGETLILSGRSGRGFLEVFVTYKGRQVRGYVLKTSLQRSRILLSTGKSFHEDKDHKWVFGALGAYSSDSQGARDLTTGPDTSYDIGDFAGQALYFGAYADWPFSTSYAIRLSLLLRQIRMEGDALLQDSPAAPSKFRVTQNFLSLAIGLKKSIFLPNLWWLAELEMAKGTSVTLDVLEGNAVDQSEVTPPFFIIGSLSLGYDIKVAKHWRVFPQARIGLAGTSPATVLMEGVLGVGYAY